MRKHVFKMPSRIDTDEAGHEESVFDSARGLSRDPPRWSKKRHFPSRMERSPKEHHPSLHPRRSKTGAG